MKKESLAFRIIKVGNDEIISKRQQCSTSGPLKNYLLIPRMHQFLKILASRVFETISYFGLDFCHDLFI